MGTCARNLHMSSLHCIQVVDHFIVFKRNVLKKWRMELLCTVLGTHTIRVSYYCHIFNYLTFYTADNLTDRQTDRLSPHTCAHSVTGTLTQLHEKWEDNCR